MRVHVAYRDPDGVIKGNTPLKCERVDDKWYCEMPDDLEAFLKLVAPVDRFAVIPPSSEPRWGCSSWSADPVYWTLEFHNDYD